MFLRPGPVLLAVAALVAVVSEAQAQHVVSTSCFVLSSETDQWGPLPDSVRVVVRDEGIPRDLTSPGIRDSGRPGWTVALGQFASPTRLFVVLPREGGGWLHVVFRPEGDVLVGDAWDGGGGEPTPEDRWRVEARPTECAGGGG